MLRRVPLLARPASRCGEPLPPFVLAESYTHAATITGLCRPTIRLHAGPTPARCHCETLHSAGVLAPEAERFKELLKAQYKGAINELSIGACEPCVILTGFHNFATSEPISRVVYELLIYMLKHRLEHLEWWLPHGPSATGVPDGKPAFPIRARKRPDGSCEFQIITAADATWATVAASHGSERAYPLPPGFTPASVWFVGALSKSSYECFRKCKNLALRVDDDGRMLHPEVLPYFWQAGPAGDFMRKWLRERLPAIAVLKD